MASEGLRKRATKAADQSEASPEKVAVAAEPPKAADLVKDEIKKNDDNKYAEKPASGHPKVVYSTAILIVFTIASLITRLYRIGWADFVVWDEAHFGKFAGFYVKREFYFDVHPPLGKMLLGLSGVLVGFNGTFQFDSGVKYPADLNYTGMRIFAALFGAFMVPLAYLTAVQLRFSPAASIFLTTLVLIDNAFLAISRFILLDSMLLFFTFTSVHCLVTFRNKQIEDVKWVGLFAIALVGIHTIEDLWELLGDVKLPWIDYAKHWIARIIFLIILPISIYIFCFYLHFKILNRSGEGDAQMSSVFQAGLEGNNFYSNPIHVAYGSRVSVKSNGRGGGLLHSHVQTYPAGSEQQQITCYHHKDSNNEWIVTRPWDYDGEDEDDTKVQFVKNNDIIRLVHDQTKRNLHSHSNFKAPVSVYDYEVSCYGNSTIGDENDHWRVEIVDDLHERNAELVKSLTTRFRLRHVMTGCLLRSPGTTLPQWGFKQAEVSCAPKGDNSSINNIWNVEQHWNDKLEPGGATAFRSSFLKDFVDLNVAMWTSNNALTPDPNKEPDQLTSEPYHWPFLLKGLRMCGWGDEDIKFFLLGHPLIWWGSAVSFFVFAIIAFVYAVRYQRKCHDWTKESWSDFYFASKVAFLGWFLHYYPFWIMGRVTYLHHYFPALYFAMIMLTLVLDHLTTRFPKFLQKLFFAALTIVFFAVFFFFADFSFGFKVPASQYKNRQWLKSWTIFD
ncbi:Protein O-mannosyltransferase 2 [Phlyctochytrium planicorne]|nr:Protein O-mannosyltransferase 2 [Phlyctochytrium planicorne]